MKKPNSTAARGQLISLGIALVVIALVAGAILLRAGTISVPNPPWPITKKATTSFGTLIEMKRSKSPGIIVTATIAKNLDLSGKPLGAAANFAKNEKEIFLVAQLQSAPPGVSIEYVRYLNGKYLDHRSLQITKAGVQYATFSWELKNAFAGHLPGEYKVKLYTNGKAELVITYTVS